MRFLLRHLLLLGVILGLAGQSAAFAASPCPEMNEQQAAAITGPMAGMADCAMGQDKPSKAPAPHKGTASGCLAMAGCASLATLDVSAAPVFAATTPAVAAQWPATPILLGRSIAPDPDPPSFSAEPFAVGD